MFQSINEFFLFFTLISRLFLRRKCLFMPSLPKVYLKLNEATCTFVTVARASVSREYSEKLDFLSTVLAKNFVWKLQSPRGEPDS